MPMPSARCRSALAASVALLALAGCASVADPYTAAPAASQLAGQDAVGECLRRFQAFDQRVDAAGVRDAQAARVPGHPYLRADRATLWSQPQDVSPEALAQARLARMAALDADGRAVEAANARVAAAEQAELERCRALLLATVSGEPSRVLDVAQPPAAYDSAARVVGLYPLTQLPFAIGVASWQHSVRELYATPFPELPLAGERLRYVPGAAGSGSVAGLLAVDANAAGPLGRAAVAPERAWQLLAEHAPVLAIDTADRNDRIGQPVWRQSGERLYVGIDDARPVGFVRVAWAEVAGAPVLQLVYGYWFAARPARGAFDPAAGHLDALLWRVTLDAQGRPLVYDSIHACGCYHMFFPTERVRARPGPLPGEGPFDETMFSPQVLRAPGTGERVVVYVSAGDHQVQRVAVDTVPPAPGIVYALASEDALRTLPLPAVAGGGTRSLFGPDGMVPGSERLERYFYWPMGVPSAGQLRQWGHHATAFVGRRTFDDPGLIERYFTLAPSAGAAPPAARAALTLTSPD
jgi:hypothetical protein